MWKRILQGQRVRKEETRKVIVCMCAYVWLWGGYSCVVMVLVCGVYVSDVCVVMIGVWCMCICDNIYVCVCVRICAVL